MDFLNASFRVGRLFGINIRVHILFLIWIAFRLMQSEGDWSRSAMFLGMLFGIVLIHEFGHCFGARSVGGDAENILMWPLGGLAYAHAPMTPWAQFVTVAAGPAVNVAFCLLSGVALVLLCGTIDIFSLSPFNSIDYSRLALAPRLWDISGGEVHPQWWVLPLCTFYSVNYFLLAFNLLPIYPMDGGQLFQCLLWPFMGLQRAMTIACQVGLVGCIGLGMWGLSQGGGGMLLFIALFGGFTCWQRLQQLKYGMVADERIKYAPYKVYKPKRASIFARLFKVKRRPSVSTPDAHDEPGDDPWRRRVEEEQRKEAEVDRILKKVREKGIHSLSYVERQTLESATRERQEREKAGRH